MATLGAFQGPRTAEGKARSARNAFKGGRWRDDRYLLKTYRRLLREQREQLKCSSRDLI